MWNLNRPALPLIKSRFAGFFAFLLLCSCQESPSQDELIRQAQRDPAIAMALATQRLASNEHQAALNFFQLAAIAGDADATLHAVKLQQRLDGNLTTALWVEQQLQLGKLQQAQLPPAVLAELGLWLQPAPYIAGFNAASGCQLTLQPVATEQTGITNWQNLQQQWQQDSQLSALPVCFLPLQIVDSTKLHCSENPAQRISCDYLTLEPIVAAGGFSQLLVISGSGSASYNNGILQLPAKAPLALLRHEFMHVLGFIDEYALSPETAASVCKPGRVYPNVIIGHNEKAYQQLWPDTTISLTAVETCRKVGLSSFRVTAEDNLMWRYELALPARYYELAQRVLQQPEKLMPVQYYFAYLARQQENWPSWQRNMQQAAQLGYANAKQALAP